MWLAKKEKKKTSIPGPVAPDLHMQAAIWSINNVHRALRPCRSMQECWRTVATIGYTHARRLNLETVSGYQICANMATVYFAVIKMTDSLFYSAINYCVVFWLSHTWMFYCHSGT